MPQFEPIFTLGNVVTIVAIFICFAGVFIKIGKFMTQSEMDRGNLHEKVDEVKKTCDECFVKEIINTLAKEKERMNNLQIQIRAELPLKLDEIWRELKTIRGFVEKNER